MKHLVTRCAALVFGALVLLACSSSSSGSSAAPTVTGVTPTQGSSSGGTPVTVLGANFQVGATVQFGSAQTTVVTFNSPTSLSTTTPASSSQGLVNVTVTNPDAQSAVLPNGFNYTLPTCALPADITSNMTLGPICVWLAPATVSVGGAANPVLEVLPGTTILFSPSELGAPGVSLQVGVYQPGSLLANGAADAGIIFGSAATTPAAGDWGGVVFGPQGSGTVIQYATIEYAGGLYDNNLPNTDSAGLTVEGGDVLSGSASQTPAPVLSNLSVNNSAGHGLVFAGLETGFGADAGNIGVTSWETTTHFPLVIEANQGGTIPTSISVTPSPSPTAVVAFQSYVADACEVPASTTWPAIPLPYLALTTVQVLSQSATASPDTLTIAAPNTVEFATGTELDVDPPPSGSDVSNGNSFLVANGTTTAPITFTSNAASPTPGAWGGINIWCTNTNQSINSSVTYAAIEWAASTHSGPTGTGEMTVLDGQKSATGPLGPVISNCSFTNYGTGAAEYGIALFDVSNVSLNAYTANNSFATTNKVIQYCSGQITDGTCPGP